VKPRTKRVLAIVAGVATLAVATGLVLNAFQSNLVFFFSPTQVAQQEAPKDRAFRIGGLVQAGSLRRDPKELTVTFVVTDTAKSVPVTYTGMLPDLFQEGRGVVAQGKLRSDGVFVADQVLAKHDENYMPPEAADALEAAKKGQMKSLHKQLDGHPAGTPGGASR
jgi:cytochrome c-type biogenesis protein CcmE